ncbi:hypothetical protein K450DRAFT_280716 [Umbelopsis ramanniana AG]|uniref:Phytanoyl-CoA dioxygenase family protein n=1 Tax=Umbelopsis ramanniana AG TaxID=1314678 RepID=A0AAD5E913_UMBRA|nr:uncharacterized protein K450DRAFT_280716 [Umbelopsis ramanniana AG]KAI8579546.1 hypothetical protein K450DRAFT_280716 [Umbelopsis ramanniana AG]
MVKITDQQIEQWRRDGYVLIPNFLSKEEVEAARQGVFEWFSPSWDEYVAAGRKVNCPEIRTFPWNNSGLNQIVLNDDLIDAAERILGTKDIHLSEAHLGMKYAGNPSNNSAPDDFHQDWRNNTIGPHHAEDFNSPAFFYCLDDVTEGMAPVQMVKNGLEPNPQNAEKFYCSAGSLCIYSTWTWHASSEFTAKEGHRPTMWLGFNKNDRMWEGGRFFTIKSTGTPDGWLRAIGEATPRQRELLFFPPAGDERWTDEMINGMEKRYGPYGFDPKPYRQAKAEKVAQA